MDFVKSNWVANENTVSITMPLTKVDKENRLVSGFATLDNIDSQKDVVTAEASKNAFARARGNIREMHQPIAAGRLVDFREDEFIHDGKIYRGIFVTAYISKGAEDTWQKVLDGTLTGFSIGGQITDSETQWVKDADTSIRFVKEYDLLELSLVDNPANQLANVFSIQKNSEGSIIKGMVAETVIENVFWCSSDELAKTSKDAAVDCLVCGKAMENIGWLEDVENKTEKVREVVSKFLSPSVETETSEGGVDVSDENVEKTAAVVEEAPADESVVKEAPVEENPAEEVTAEADEKETVEEVTDEPDFAKMIDGLKEAVDQSLEKNRELTTEAVANVEAKVEEINKALETKTSELETALGELSEKISAVRQGSEEVTKRLDALEGSTAVRKSGDLESPEPVQKSTGWSGAFLGIDNLQK